MKYSILMPYHDRADHLHNTLRSLCGHYGARADYEVVIVEDRKNYEDTQLHAALNDVMQGTWARGVPIVWMPSLRPEPSPVCKFNQAAAHAAGEYLVITNPECYHESDVLGWFDEVFATEPNAYAVCACESLAGPTVRLADDAAVLPRKHHMWYQHTQHRNECYHFCTALSRANYIDIGGFDERYAYGIAYDDDDFRNRVRRHGLPFIVIDDIIVLHQDHSKAHGVADRHQHKIMLQRNQQLFQETWHGQGA